LVSLGNLTEADAMTVVGLVLFLAGVGGYGLVFTGNAPAQLAQFPDWVFIAVGAVGLVLIMLNRRPAN